MKPKHKPTARDPLKRQAVIATKRQSGITGVQDDGTYIKVDGTVQMRKTVWLEESFARRFAAFCASRGTAESAFVRDALEAQMARLEREG